MNIRLPFGTEQLPIDVPDNWINGRCYRSFLFEPMKDAPADMAAALNAPIGDAPLSVALKGRQSVCVVVDASRPAVTQQLLAPFLEQLEAQTGLGPGAIRLLVANTLWLPLTHEDLHSRLPDAVRERYEVVLHNPFNATDSRRLLSTRLENAPLKLNSLFLEAEGRILFGAAVPSLVFGFEGGRSLILPGIAHESTIEWLYRYENVAHPAIRFGSLRDNPLHMAATELLQALPIDFGVSVVVTPDGQPSQVFAGDAGQSFMQAVGRMREKMSARLKEPMDIVVTSGGGRPHDQTLAQVVDAMSAVLPVLKPDGTIVIAAELLESFGPYPMRELLLSASGPKGFETRYANLSHVVPAQWIAQRFFSILKEHEVIIHTRGISEDEAWSAGMTPAKDMQEAIEEAMKNHGQRCKICALPDGPFALGTLAIDGIQH